MLHGNFGFNLADEGFFWYGAKQTAKGEIPGIDFMAYEPGRYYWAALIFKALGDDSNKAARIASTLFGAVAYGSISCFCISLRPAIRARRSLEAAIILPVMLSVWTFPYYRVTDVAAPGFAFIICAHQYIRRSPQSSFHTGIAIGLTMFFGRNHALYAVMAQGIILVNIFLQERGPGTARRLIVMTCAGMGIGAFPFAIIAAFRPGYPSVLLRQWLDVFRIGRTNLPLPWPLPWNTIKPGMELGEIDGHLLTSIIFLSLFAIGIGGSLAALFSSLNKKYVSPCFVATAAATAGYLHYATSRSDLEHIGPAFVPLLVGIFAWGTTKPRMPFFALTALLLYPTARLSLRQQSAYHCIRNTIPCSQIDMRGGHLVLAPTHVANQLSRMLKEVEGRSFMAAPAYPVLYAYTDSKSPTWDIYAATPRTDQEQYAEIERIKNRRPQVILLGESAFGEGVEYSKTNPVLHRYITGAYKKSGAIKGTVIVIYRRV
ncbi:hypothetical protein NZK27_09770 [Synechococcus sp. FGCU-3]|nr:hypothetical protein [Synechococcus sp. FGCU3]